MCSDPACSSCPAVSTSKPWCVVALRVAGWILGVEVKENPLSRLNHGAVGAAKSTRSAEDSNLHLADLLRVPEKELSKESSCISDCYRQVASYHSLNNLSSGHHPVRPFTNRRVSVSVKSRCFTAWPKSPPRPGRRSSGRSSIFQVDWPSTERVTSIVVVPPTWRMFL